MQLVDSGCAPLMGDVLLPPDVARVMIAVKASPEIGRTHGETVCVAGVRLNGDRLEWIRLFPVSWKWFWGKEHPKYQVIDVEVVKHNRDQRPESFRPRLETAVVERAKSTAAQRAEVLNALPQMSMCDLVAAKGWGRPSLGLVVPREVKAVTWERQDETAQRKRMNLSAQGSLLDPGAPRLHLPEYAFRLEYVCMAPACRGHRQSIVDWEISEAERTWPKRYPDDFLERIETKWLELLDPERQPGLFVGNQQQAPQGFLVLGICRDVTPAQPTRVGPNPEEPRLPASDGTRTDQPRNTAGQLFEI